MLDNLPDILSWELPQWVVYTMGSIWSDVQVMLKAIIPKSLALLWLDQFFPRICLQFFYFLFYYNLLGGEWHTLLQLAWSLLELSVECTLDHPLALSHGMGGGIPSCWKINDSASCASLFNFIKIKHDHIKTVSNIYAHLIPLLDFVFADNVSLYMLCASLLYSYWQSFMLNHISKNGCNNFIQGFPGKWPHFFAGQVVQC